MPALTGKGMRSNWAHDDAWCPGCGLHHHVTGAHRPDCTAHPSPLACAAPACTATRPAGARTPIWRYGPTRNTYYCPEHRP